jgi:two-component system, LytTR family, response regulator
MLKNLDCKSSSNFSTINDNQNSKIKLVVPTLRGPVFIPSNEVIYIQALSNYSKIFLSNGKWLVVSQTLKKFESYLTQSSFHRIHNSCLVNLQFMEKLLKSNKPILLLRNGIKLDISRRKYVEFKKSISHNIMGSVA